MEPGLLKSAEWPLLIDLYFFLGGLAGGAEYVCVYRFSSEYPFE